MNSIDPNCTQLRPLAEYCKRLPSSRPGRKLNRATLYRWALKGTRDGNFLRTVSIGGGRFTRDTWVAQFMRERCWPALAEPVATDRAEYARIAQALGAKDDRRAA